MNMFLPCNRKQHIITEVTGVSTARMQIWQKWLLGEVTWDVNFPLLRHDLGWQSDAINVKNFHETLRSLFQILRAPLLSILSLIASVYFSSSTKIFYIFKFSSSRLKLSIIMLWKK